MSYMQTSHNKFIAVMYMQNLSDIEILFVIGIIKELYKKQLISEKQMFAAINKINEKKKARK